MLSILIWILAFVVAITVHETAHAWMADRLGDPTPRLTGRLSLNPLVHYDPVGTTLLLILVLLRAIGIPVIPFGWAKPVRFDPFNLRNPKRDTALISLAGPSSNLLLAGILGLVLHLTNSTFLSLLFPPLIVLNLALGIFNLLPIHPLDGGKILVGFLPDQTAEDVDRFLNRYGMLLLFLLIFPTFRGVSPVAMIISPILNFLLNLLIPGQIII